MIRRAHALYENILVNDSVRQDDQRASHAPVPLMLSPGRYRLSFRYHRITPGLRENGVVNAGDLATELQRIYDGEINVEIGWLWDGGIDVRLENRLNGYLPEVRERAARQVFVPPKIGALVI